jgi:hypothetical protein
MSTQAQGPAPAQVQQPVHPVHEETAIHERLTKIVSETPENDPHEGTDLESPKAEVKAEEPKAEAKAEEKPEAEGEKYEFDEDAPVFEMPDLEDPKKTVKASLKELREQRMMKADYHRSIQKVKAQEAELSTKAQQAEQKALQEYAQRLEHHKQAVQRLAGVKTMPEIDALSRQDPAAAQQEFLRLISVNQTMQAIETEQRAAVEKHQQAVRVAHAQAIEKSRQTLESDIPNWNAELYTKVLGGVAKDYGFQNTEVEPVVDARLIKVFHDAYQYKQLQKAKPEISRKVVAVPKVVKPGSAEKPNTSTTAVDEAATRLKKSGKGEDFVEYYMALQKQQKRK